MIKLRRAVAADAQVISLLARVSSTESFLTHFKDQQDLFNYHEQTFDVGIIRRSLQKENNVYWIALWNELPVGFAKLELHSVSRFISSGRACQLSKMYVSAEFLGKGIAKLLMSEIIKYFEGSDHTHLWLSVLKANSRAIKFYDKNEFVYTGEYKLEIGKEVLDFLVLFTQKNNN